MNDFASANLTIGQLNAIVKNLGGEQGALRFLRGELIVTPVAPAPFKVFKTIKLRMGIDADGYRKAIKGKKVGSKKTDIGQYANDILGKPAFAVVTEEMELDLVVVSVKELTGKDRASLKEIFACAKEKGLHLCPNQTGPEFRLQYEDQPKGGVIIGMEPITVSDGDLRVFFVRHNDYDLWLDTVYGGPDNVWGGDYQFVFVLPRK